jgi:hypothetical protein
MDMTEKGAHEPDTRAVEIIQSEQHREEEDGKMKTETKVKLQESVGQYQK